MDLAPGEYRICALSRGGACGELYRTLGEGAERYEEKIVLRAEAAFEQMARMPAGSTEIAFVRRQSGEKR